MANTAIQILQFGTGNFLRAFFGSMVQDLNETGNNLNICIIQSTSSDNLLRLAAQDYSFSLLVAGFKDGEKVEQIRPINCIKDGLKLPQEQDKFMEFASSSQLKWIISNVTEAGMVMKEEGPFEKFAESFAGRLTQWLFRRFETIPEMKTVVLPCELLPDNGTLLKSFVLSHAKKWELSLEFQSWIQDKVSFHNSLVDRIVPGFPSHLNLKEKESDPFLVQAEPYALWAIEGVENDRTHLPFLDSSSEVILTGDISGYALRKVRILNASHTAMTGHGLLHGFETVGEWIAAPECEKLLFEMIDREIIPTIKSDKEALKKYANDVLDRFRNPFVSHKLSDISLNSIAKLKSRLLPILIDYREITGHYPPKTSLCLLALLLFYLRNPGKIKDSEEIKTWFEHASQSHSEIENLKTSLSHWLNLEWNLDFEFAYDKLI
ncbi:tagaturonate reductase [Algoriphagus boritolerans]|uniref:Tagaturonate reductase n=1 Tax=Algoriphagus boritolerans DSM 17298 = JCM 18970 TaxID=1120964 RepID=A0A1H5TXC3_9BACT|nr:tagaturonate reductase [Algoriphagus boritolerans]SEF66691.1 tagaturonate reductase [Algoriphagus boritolerans DSM 17298 = JCM 18970]